jgi:hypothetical protein
MTSKRDGVHLAGKRAEKSRLGSGKVLKVK